jgi:hypothetical protein
MSGDNMSSGGGDGFVAWTCVYVCITYTIRNLRVKNWDVPRDHVEIFSVVIDIRSFFCCSCGRFQAVIISIWQICCWFIQ